jgi:hypothetical protein
MEELGSFEMSVNKSFISIATGYTPDGRNSVPDVDRVPVFSRVHFKINPSTWQLGLLAVEVIS